MGMVGQSQSQQTGLNLTTHQVPVVPGYSSSSHLTSGPRPPGTQQHPLFATRAPSRTTATPNMAKRMQSASEAVRRAQGEAVRRALGSWHDDIENFLINNFKKTRRDV